MGAAKAGCGCNILFLIVGIAMYVFFFAEASASQDPGNPDGPPKIIFGSLVGFAIVVFVLACCANIVQLYFGCQMYQNDNELHARQASGQTPSGPIQGQGGAEMA